MGAEVCAKTCSKRYVPKQPLDTSDLVTGRDGNAGDGNAGDGNAFQQQLATIFADETIARISKAFCNGNALVIIARISAATCNNLC